jgi:hypothetical protein
LKNHDLITQRIEYLLKKVNRQADTKFSTIQKEINDKIIMFKDKMKM